MTEETTKFSDDELLKGLKMPAMNPREMLRHFGPGLLHMMTGVGTSHLVTAPVAGGRFEYLLLWCLPVAYIFKYYGFEMAFRFTNATGRSIMDAYATAWGKWPLWYVLIVTLIQCALGQAGRLVAASAVLFYFFTEFLGTELPMWVFGGALGVLSVSLILGGQYKALELATKVMAGMLFVSSVIVYFIEPAPLESFAYFFQLATPEGSWLIIAAFLGLLPTGIDVSLQASEWGKAKKAGMGAIRDRLEDAGLAPRFDPFNPRKADLEVRTLDLPPSTREYCKRWFRIGELDFAVGHVISFIIACIFLLLAAVALYPSEVQGNAVIGEIATMFTSRLGAGMVIIFLIGAFAALFSTALNYFDGWPRVVAACARNLFRPTASLKGVARSELTEERRSSWYSEYNIYRATMFYSLVASVALIAGLQRPVWLVLVASALAFFIAPVIYFLNVYYCVTVISRNDPDFYPSRFVRGFAWLSFVVFTAFTLIVIIGGVFQGRVVSG